MRRLALLALLGLLATREAGVRTNLPLAGPWGQGVDITQVHWLDNDRVLFVDDEEAFSVTVDGGEVAALPLGSRHLLGVRGEEWLVAAEGEEGRLSHIFLGPPGAEEMVDTRQGSLSLWELAWPERGPWLRGWLGGDGDGPQVGRGPAWAHGDDLWLLDPTSPGALWRLSSGDAPVQVAGGDAAAGLRLAAAAPAASGQALLAHTQEGRTRLSLVGRDGAVVWSLPWNDTQTYGLYGEHTVAWRVSPRVAGAGPQMFCSPVCEEVPAGTWMQSRAWSLGAGRWVLALRDLKTGEVVLATAPGMETFARLDRMRTLAVSPDGTRLALARAVERRRWDWDLVVLAAPPAT